jgi:multiple sugar transport system substrate-binding protein/putative aldouronate transport system substrate-binding protein
MKDIGTTYTIVSDNASEDVKKAIVIMNNVLVRDESIFDTSVAIGWYPVRNTMAVTDESEYEYDALYSILKGEASIDDYQLGGSLFNGAYKNLANDAATLYDVISEDYDPSERLNVTDMDVNTNNGQFNRLTAILIGDRPYATIEPDNKIYSEIYYTIDGMETYWTQVSDMEDSAILQFITGAKSLDEWDQFCEDWHAQGGDQILELVSEYLGE